MKSIKLNTKVSEWVLFKIRLAFFQLYDEIMLALYKTNQLRWMLIVLVHYNSSPQVEMLLPSDTIVLTTR